MERCSIIIVTPGKYILDCPFVKGKTLEVQERTKLSDICSDSCADKKHKGFGIISIKDFKTKEKKIENSVPA